MRLPIALVAGAALAVAAALPGFVSPSATLADGDDHNCAGAVTSSLAGPGFGDLVAFYAHLQFVDNFGLANCGDTEGQNP